MLSAQQAADFRNQIAALYRLLRQALAFVGHVQTRNRGTLGGSLAHDAPGGDRA